MGYLDADSGGLIVEITIRNMKKRRRKEDEDQRCTFRN